MSNEPMHCNSNTYALASSASSAAITFIDQDINSVRLIVANGTACDAFAVLWETAAPTAVFPTSATAPLQGTVIPSGSVVTLSKSSDDKYLAMISAGADSGKYLYVQVGSGE